MPTHTHEYTRNCEEGKHLLAFFGGGGFPPVNAGVKTFRQAVNFIDVEPCDIIRGLWDIDQALDGLRDSVTLT
jgi:hypothetical protein